MNHVEIITIGDELLLGNTVDTNAAFLSRELVSAGFRVVRRATIGDGEQEIETAVRDALARVSIVITTGGLGPTQDDLTRPVIARVFDAPLEVDSDILDELKARFGKRGMAMPERNITQAEVPRGATVLPNARGTAPGLVLETADHRVCILLPGVPSELRALCVEQVIPFVRSRGSIGVSPITYRVLRTTGIAESAIAGKVDAVIPQLAPLTLAFLPDITGTNLRLTSWGDLPAEKAKLALDRGEAALRAVIDDYIYAVGDEDLAAVVGRMLRERAFRLSVAESCTGGLLGKRITDIAGSSEYFMGGTIAYADTIKERVLAVSPKTIAVHGAVSEPVVREMAVGAQRAHDTDAAIAVTGIAGPGGGSPEKPVGTVWIAAAVADRVEARRVVLPGDRGEIRERAAQAGLALLWRMLRDPEPTPRTAP